MGSCVPLGEETQLEEAIIEIKIKNRKKKEEEKKGKELAQCRDVSTSAMCSMCSMWRNPQVNMDWNGLPGRPGCQSQTSTTAHSALSDGLSLLQRTLYFTRGRGQGRGQPRSLVASGDR